MKDFLPDLTRIIQSNCDISDARDNGIYSLCILVLKLRNLYKWENHIEPWDESDSAVVLNWIEEREACWEKIGTQEYHPYILNGKSIDPFDTARMNEKLKLTNLFYGAGYGRSLKALFFLGEIIAKREVAGRPVIILGRETARELASPFAMVQDGQVIVRRDPMRFFFWDRLQEAEPSAKAPLLYALELHGLLDQQGKLDRKLLKANLDILVDQEMEAIIRHEIGEMQNLALTSQTLSKIAADFPDSLIEFVARAVKDILADTHESGRLSYIITEEKEASLAFYVAFLDGLRKHLFPEISQAFSVFRQDKNWRQLRAACQEGRVNNTIRAEKITLLINETADPAIIKTRVESEILAPIIINHIS
ncbi:MAG: hypothetical protein A2511_05855 [Deltaproteobacteria bacterium RIFOXYD12_FULL_50_9]|nr:MAG: hypothetical protein A2511_05855 [Deltaproteobacteria bacterium RIFOXYD12_FULL_50_9]